MVVKYLLTVPVRKTLLMLTYYVRTLAFGTLGHRPKRWGVNGVPFVTVGLGFEPAV